MSREPLNIGKEGYGGSWEGSEPVTVGSSCRDRSKVAWNHWSVKLLILVLLSVTTYFAIHPALHSTVSPSPLPPSPAVVPNCTLYLSPKDFPQENVVPTNIARVLSEISALLEKTLSNISVPAVAAGISYRGKTIWYKGAGTITKKLNKTFTAFVPPTQDTLFRIGSVSKVYPVLTLFHLVEKGVIASLDDEVSKYCPLFKVKDRFVNANQRAPTWRQLASQLSGLPREAPCDIYSCNFTNEEMFSRISEMYLISPAYTRGSYSNLAFSILARAQEYIVNATFEDYCVREMKALGMNSTGFDCESVASEMAAGWNRDGSQASLVDIGWSAPAGQMYASVRDLLTLSKLLLGGDSPYLSKSYLSELLSPLTINPDGSTFFGTPWEQTFQKGYLVNRKGGNIDGFSSLMALVPQLEIAVVVLWNGPMNQFIVSDSLFDVLLPAFVDFLTPLNKPAVPSDPASYLGNFSLGLALNLEIIFDTDGSMMIQSFSPGFINLTLTYVQPGLMAIISPPMDCLFKSLYALEGEYVHFSGGPPYTSFEIPGLVGGVIFNRTA